MFFQFIYFLIFQFLKLTKELLIDLYKVQDKYINVIDIGKTHVFKLNDEYSFNVDLIDANHCPGAVMYLFNGYFGTVLATGDFRYEKRMFIEPPLNTYIKNTNRSPIELLYIDNTYCSPHYSNIPTRIQALNALIVYIKLNNQQSNKKFIIKMKKLGKEELLINLAKHFKCKILLTKERYLRYEKIFKLDMNYFTYEFDALYDDDVFIEVEDSTFKNEKYGVNCRFKDYFSFHDLIFIEPTALYLNVNSYKCKTRSNSHLITHYIPYTDHSTYTELIEFVKQLKPKKLFGIVKEQQNAMYNTCDINDFKCFYNYLNKDPLINTSHVYRLLLQTKLSLLNNCSMNNNGFENINNGYLSNNNQIEFNNKRILKKRTRTMTDKILYENDSPVKKRNNKWKQLNDHVEILNESYSKNNHQNNGNNENDDDNDDDVIIISDDESPNKQISIKKSPSLLLNANETKIKSEKLTIESQQQKQQSLPMIKQEKSLIPINLSKFKLKQFSIILHDCLKEVPGKTKNQTKLPIKIDEATDNTPTLIPETTIVEPQIENLNDSIINVKIEVEEHDKSIIIDHTIDDRICNDYKLSNEKPNFNNNNEDTESYTSAISDVDYLIQINKENEINNAESNNDKISDNKTLNNQNDNISKNDQIENDFDTIPELTEDSINFLNSLFSYDKNCAKIELDDFITNILFSC